MSSGNVGNGVGWLPVIKVAEKTGGDHSGSTVASFTVNIETFLVKDRRRPYQEITERLLIHGDLVVLDRKVEIDHGLEFFVVGSKNRFFFGGGEVDQIGHP